MVAVCHLGLPGVHTALGIQAGKGGLPVVSPPRLFKWRCSNLLVLNPSIFQAQWCGTSCQEESNKINYTALMIPALHFATQKAKKKFITSRKQQNKEQFIQFKCKYHSDATNKSFNAHISMTEVDTEYSKIQEHAQHKTVRRRGNWTDSQCPTQHSI